MGDVLLAIFGKANILMLGDVEIVLPVSVPFGRWLPSMIANPSATVRPTMDADVAAFGDHFTFADSACAVESG